MVPVQSITRPWALRLGPTATIRFPSISTSAFSKSPTSGSRLSTMPPFSTFLPGSLFHRIGTSGAAVGVVPASIPGATAAATTPAAPPFRNSRRDVALWDPGSSSDPGSPGMPGVGGRLGMVILLGTEPDPRHIRSAGIGGKVTVARGWSRAPDADQRRQKVPTRGLDGGRGRVEGCEFHGSWLPARENRCGAADRSDFKF